VNRSQRDTDWGDDLRASGLFDVGDRITVPWTRELDVDTWITDLASHSYVMALDPPARSALLRVIREVVLRAFPDGSMRVPLETQLWIATSR
jgi:selenophosphate synthetase-related protein